MGPFQTTSSPLRDQPAGRTTVVIQAWPTRLPQTPTRSSPAAGSVTEFPPSRSRDTPLVFRGDRLAREKSERCCPRLASQLLCTRHRQ